MTEKTPSKNITQSTDNGLAIASMVLGVVSLSGPGLLLGIPAIILAIIALKKKAGGRGLSIAGLVTGIVSTVLSLLFIAFIIFMMIWSTNEPDTRYDTSDRSNNYYRDTYQEDGPHT